MLLIITSIQLTQQIRQYEWKEYHEKKNCSSEEEKRIFYEEYPSSVESKAKKCGNSIERELKKEKIVAIPNKTFHEAYRDGEIERDESKEKKKTLHE